MILITGATGHLGKAVLDFLIKRNNLSGVAAMVRDTTKAVQLQEKGIVLRVGDYNNYESLLNTFEGVQTLLFISSSSPLSSERREHHINVVNAAKECGVKHIIYTSVLNASDTAKFLPAIEHAHTEQFIQRSGFKYTIFRNTMYAEVILQLMGNALETGAWYYAAGEAKNNFTARSEIAEALANVLQRPAEHENKVYEITSGKSYSCTEISYMISELTGRELTFVTIPVESLKEGLKSASLPEPIIQLLVSGAEAINAGEFNNPQTSLEQILGRKPIDLKDHLKTLI